MPSAKPWKVPDLETFTLAREPETALNIAQRGSGGASRRAPSRGEDLSGQIPLRLPAELTSFIGREQELAELVDLLSQTRLLTITGAAGLGKTRLALRVAAHVATEWRDGVCLVELADVNEPAGVVRAAAESIGVREETGTPLAETLAEHLSSSQILLVLDGCEHVLESGAALAERLLKRCPALSLLATSREKLHVDGEISWRTPPLEEVESVQLLVARARLVDHRFKLTPAEAVVVAEICRRLDYIPLAIELAAARVEMMSPVELLSRLENSFHLLTDRRPGAHRRQTLEAAIDWSYELLDDAERLMFRRLSTFAGGFDLDAAEAVCAGLHSDRDQALDGLTRLVDKSLVVPESNADGPTRYRILETLRRYGAHQLEAHGEAAEARERHAGYFLALAEQAQTDAQGPEQPRWLQRLEEEQANLRLALAWSREFDRDIWQRLALALAWFWVTRGYLAEGRDWLQEALAGPAPSPQFEAAGLLWLARLVYWQADYQTARQLAERSLAICTEVGDEINRGWALNLLGSISIYDGRPEEGREWLQKSLEVTLDTTVRIEALMTSGELDLQQGDVISSRELFKRALGLARTAGQQWRASAAVLFLALIAFFEGDQVAARSLLLESLAMFQATGNRYAQAATLNVFAALAVAGNDPERALRLCGAAEAARAAIRAPLAARWQEVTDTIVVQPAREALGSAGDAAWNEGGSLSLEKAIAYAVSGTAGVPSSRRREPAATAGPLSRREREVSAHVAAGMTNRQIANQLGIAERTVEGHVERIRAKLGFRSRAQIAAWSAQHGLLIGAATAKPEIAE